MDIVKGIITLVGVIIACLAVFWIPGIIYCILFEEGYGLVGRNKEDSNG